MCAPLLECAMRNILEGYILDKREAPERKIKVGLLGFGKTNRAVLDVLTPLDCVEITVRGHGLKTDAIPYPVRAFGGEGAFSLIDEDVIIPSPSVRRESLTLPRGCKIITDYDLFFGSMPKRLFSVSGSDGKSTVTTIASLLLFPSFPDLFVGGNIGTPLILAGADSSAFLLELSSFTLHYCAPKCGRALITNITPNHLDWHKDLDEYIDSKLSLIKRSNEPILNISDKVSNDAARDICAFCLVSDRLSHREITAKYNTKHTVTVEDDEILLDGEGLIPIALIRRQERHNVENLALAIALSIGYTSREHIRKVATSFEGLKERCERFTVGGVDYISSSIDTSPMRTKTTLEGLDRQVNIILGGRTKRLPLDVLKEPLVKYAARIAIYGEASEEFLDFISSYPELKSIPHSAFPMLSEAIAYASEGVRCGDVVLLSPAATSYGEFESYIERGRFFKDYVQKRSPKI